jgi:hypothetical protein
MKTPITLVLLTLFLAWLVALEVSLTAESVEQVEQVPASCIPPGFGEPVQHYAIDSASNGCGLRGRGTGKTVEDREKQEIQNLMKNNFCA